MTSDNDPRVYFAAERTLLAWVRTGLAVMGLGFIVARFGLFLRLLTREGAGSAHPASTAIGVALVLLGALAMALAAWQHARFVKTLPPIDRPRSYAQGWQAWFAVALAIVGVVLAGYIVMRSNVGPTH